MSSPKISVLVPTYNYARFLPEAIESVLAQEFRDFELLIVDDCSADNTAAAVARFASAIRGSISQSTRPIWAWSTIGITAWNWPGANTSSFYSVTTGCAHPDALGKMLALLEKNPQAMLAASARVIFDDRSAPLMFTAISPKAATTARKIIRACLMRNGKNLVGEPSAVLFRKGRCQAWI